VRPRRRTKKWLRHWARCRYQVRRWIALWILGGACSACESTVDLEIDHVDPDVKSANPTHFLTWSESRFRAELAKCQALCSDCHKEKTFRDDRRADAA
jgi:5-methylcytosine-specific restriction endonuclease McrA